MKKQTHPCRQLNLPHCRPLLLTPRCQSSQKSFLLLPRTHKAPLLLHSSIRCPCSAKSTGFDEPALP